MPSYIIVDTKTRKAIVISLAVGIAAFILGILIGYFSANPGGSSDSVSFSTSASGKELTSEKGVCNAESLASPKVNQYVKRYLERHNVKHACIDKTSDCLDFDLPRNYIAYHLQGKKIKLDGKLDEPAWEEVSVKRKSNCSSFTLITLYSLVS